MDPMATITIDPYIVRHLDADLVGQIARRSRFSCIGFLWQTHGRPAKALIQVALLDIGEATGLVEARGFAGCHGAGSRSQAECRERAPASPRLTVSPVHADAPLAGPGGARKSSRYTDSVHTESDCQLQFRARSEVGARRRTFALIFHRTRQRPR